MAKKKTVVTSQFDENLNQSCDQLPTIEIAAEQEDDQLQRQRQAAAIMEKIEWKQKMFERQIREQQLKEEKKRLEDLKN